MPYKTPPPTPQPKTYWDAQGKIHYYPPTITPTKYVSFMNTPGYNMGHADSALKGFNIVLPCTPDLPSGYIGDQKGKSLSRGDEDTVNGGVKTANTSTFEQTVFNSLPDYAIEEKLSLIALTANEFLEVSHRENFYTDNLVLNNNILNLVDTISAFSPTEIIKLQTPDLGYFQNNLSSYAVSLPTNSSVVTISIPNYKADSSYKVEVQNFAPRYIKNDTIY